MDRAFAWLDQALGSFDEDVPTSFDHSCRGGSYTIQKDKDTVRIQVGVPGCRPEDVTVTKQGTLLLVRAKSPTGQNNFRFKIGASEDITAKLQDGLLTILVRRDKSEPGAKNIPVTKG